MTATVWHPSAKRVIIAQAPQGLAMTHSQGRYCTWHSTEGSSIEGAEAAYRANGDCPTFTIAHVNGKRILHQHLPITVAASALRHPTGTRPTNTLGKIHVQVEIVGFARDSGAWSDAKYHYLNLLALWLHKHGDIPLTTPVLWRHPKRLRESEPVHSGHYGHMHWYNQDHTDPGVGFHIGKVIK